MDQSNTVYDTQAVSYALKGVRDVSISNALIASATAQELLLMQSGDLTKNNYYIPFRLKSMHPDGQILKALRKLSAGPDRHSRGRVRTDRLVLDFGHDYPTVVEWSHRAIAAAINARSVELFKAFSSSLEKSKHQTVCTRFQFLVANQVQCIPLTQRTATVGLQLLGEFAQKYKLKANFRNSLNDMLVLAVAIDQASHLITYDKLLAGFAESHLAASVSEKGDLL